MVGDKLPCLTYLDQGWWFVCVHPIPRQMNPKNNLPETNIAPENGWLEDYLGMPIFQVLCKFQRMYISYPPWN